MGNFWTVNGTHAVAATTEVELITVEADTTNPFIIHSVRIGQSSEEGDVQAEMLRIQVGRYSGAQGTVGGAAAIESPHEQGIAVATVSGYVGSETLSGTKTVIIEDGFNVQAGFLYLPTPEERIIIAGGEGAFVGIPVGPADAVTFMMSMTIEELMIS